MMMPSLSVVHTVPSRRRNEAPGALLAAEAKRAAHQPFHHPLESHGHFHHLQLQAGRHAVDHAARYQRLAHRRAGRPSGPVLEQKRNRHRQVMIGIQQARAARHHAVPVVIGIAGERHVEAVLQRDQAGHGVGRGAVHADLAVPIDGHEAEGGIERIVQHGQRHAVAFADAAPIGHAGAAQRIRADVEARAADGVHIQHAAQIVHVCRNIIVAVCCGYLPRALVRHAQNLAQPALQQFVGAVFDPARRAGIRRAAIRRIVFESAIVRRIVRGRDHDAVGQAVRAPAIVGQDGVRQRRSGRIAARAVDHGVHAVGGQHFQRADPGGIGERVRVHGQEQRAADASPACGTGRWPA